MDNDFVTPQNQPTTQTENISVQFLTKLRQNMERTYHELFPELEGKIGKEVPKISSYDIVRTDEASKPI